MALSLFPKLCFLVATFVLFSAMVASRSREFSIAGYSPDDLTSIDGLINLFESWIEEHGKTYKSIEEKLHRFEIFKDNLKYVDARNKVISNYWLGLNAFADLSHDEYKKMYLGLRVDQLSKRKESLHEFKYRDFENLPKSIDWRKKGAVTRVKNQGQCGSCWAFSAVAAVEGINQIVTMKLIALSEQELIDCDRSFNQGCDGGLMDYAFTYIATNGGLVTEDEYPTTMKNGTCKENDKSELFTISGFNQVPANDERSLLKAIAHQPVSVAIDASSKDFQLYKGGVFEGACGTDLDHGVAAVGYTETYIIVKNSWGTKWGDKGYIRMKRSTGEGLCGINKMASFPIKND